MIADGVDLARVRTNVAELREDMAHRILLMEWLNEQLDNLERTQRRMASSVAALEDILREPPDWIGA